MLDSTFGTKGQVTTNFSRSGGTQSHDVPYAMAIESDGKIVLAGQTNSDIGLARYETNGNLDDGSKKDITPKDRFGSGGLFITSHTLIAGVDEAAATDMVVDTLISLIPRPTAAAWLGTPRRTVNATPFTGLLQVSHIERTLPCVSGNGAS
jgi:hypothetical protein